ncbi:MAG: ABC transporter permease [Gammaproteobacteria bacterium]
MELVVLKTDALFFLLIVLACVYAWYASRHEHLAAPWRQVAQRPLGMSAAVVLAAFVSIALLDSCHFLPSEDSQTGRSGAAGETASLLDVLVSPLRNHVETTYSAPFAAYAYAKEVVYQADGTVRREYPRLDYGGRHLDDPATQLAGDLTARTVHGLLRGLVVWSVIGLVVVTLLARRQRRPWVDLMVEVARGRTRIPWYAILLTLAAVCAVVGIVHTVGPYYHLLGTDKTGNDVLYQALKSVRTGLLIGTLTTLVMLPFAIVLGIAAGYFRGWVDDVIQYLYTTLSSIPGVLLIAAAALMLEVYMARHAGDYTSLAARADLRLLALCMILGVTTWTGLCRYLRGEALKLREIDFIAAARAFGVPHWVIIVRHIVPNIMHIVMISIVLDFSGLVLAEAALTYIDIGVDPSMESWGNMINSARLELAREPVVWWSLSAAFGFMFALVLAANVFADAVRDAFDPRLRVVA